MNTEKLQGVASLGADAVAEKLKRDWKRSKIVRLPLPSSLMSPFRIKELKAQKHEIEATGDANSKNHTTLVQSVTHIRITRDREELAKQRE